MTFDFKKEYKELYMPKNKPVIATIPKVNYIAVRGKGNPNAQGGVYQECTREQARRLHSNLPGQGKVLKLAARDL